MYTYPSEMMEPYYQNHIDTIVFSIVSGPNILTTMLPHGDNILR